MKAKEFIRANNDADFRLSMSGMYLSEMLIEFAKYHVGLALKAALESIPCLGSSTDIATYEEIEEAVLNSYDLNNIQ